MKPDNRDIALIAHLRSGRKMKVTDISRALQIPATTLYDRLGLIERDLGAKYTTLVEFEKLGYARPIHIGIKTSPTGRDALEAHLMQHPAVNSLYRVNHGYDFLAHLVFKDAGEIRAFLETLQSQFGVEEFTIFETIKELAREKFLSRSIDKGKIPTNRR